MLAQASLPGERLRVFYEERMSLGQKSTLQILCTKVLPGNTVGPVPIWVAPVKIKTEK